jgi:2-methylcitrate synthase
MSQSEPKKTKKGVALSGVNAGQTSVCTVGNTGNDLHYRGYDIIEEVAYLLIYGELPSEEELKTYIAKLKNLRDLPNELKLVLENIPKNTHPMDVMRTGCSMLGTLEPESSERNIDQARNIADRLISCFGSMLIYWYKYSQEGIRLSLNTNEDTIAGHFLHLLHNKKPSKLHEKVMNTSLVLYAEHEFNASTFTSRVIAGTLSDFYSSVTVLYVDPNMVARMKRPWK